MSRPHTRRVFLRTLLVVLALAARRLGAQDAPASRGTRLDRLRFSGIGVQIGVARPLHVESAPSVSMVTDHGEIGRGYRFAFTASYWGSRFDRQTARTYPDSLRSVAIDPSGADTVRLADIATFEGLELVLLGHVALGADARYDPFSLARHGPVRVGVTHYFDSATLRGNTPR